MSAIEEGGAVSVPMNPAAPAAKRRPVSVSISTYLLFLVAALQVISGVIGIAMTGRIRDAVNEVISGPDAEAFAWVFNGSIIISAAFNFLTAIGLVVLAVLNNRGKNPARIVTWVLGGILLCCTGFGLLGQASNSFLTGAGAPTDPDMPDPAEIQRAVDEALPGWYLPVSMAAMVISLIALAAALILLALPVSNEFFRRPAPAWEPPLPGSTYPGYPPPNPPAGPYGPPPPPAS